MRRSLAALVLLLLSACAAPGPTQPAVGSRQALLNLLSKNFDAIVFGREYAARSRFIYKWTGPVRVVIIGQLAPAEVALLDHQLQLLSQLSGLPISRFEPRFAGEIALYVESRHKLRERVGERMQGRAIPPDFSSAACISMANGRRDGRLVNVQVFIPEDIGAGEIGDCLIEEVTQSLGLFNDVDGLPYSLFSDLNQANHLTVHDALLVRALYSPALPVGLDHDLAMQRVRAILSDMLDKEGVVGDDLAQDVPLHLP